MCVGCSVRYPSSSKLSNILESPVSTQLKAFLIKHCILSQSGFKANHSNISAVTLVLNDVTTAEFGLDNKKHHASLFIHLSKAFDTVVHPLLLQRSSSPGL